MQKTILISGTYPILDEKLNDLLGRSYDIGAGAALSGQRAEVRLG